MGFIYMKMQKITFHNLSWGFLACVWEGTLIVQLNNFFNELFGLK